MRSLSPSSSESQATEPAPGATSQPLDQQGGLAKARWGGDRASACDRHLRWSIAVRRGRATSLARAWEDAAWWTRVGSEARIIRAHLKDYFTSCPSLDRCCCEPLSRSSNGSMFADIRAVTAVVPREWMIRAFVMHASVAELWIRLTVLSNTEAAAGGSMSYARGRRVRRS